MNVCGTQFVLNPQAPGAKEHMSSALCNECACESVACGRCICLHSQSIAREFKVLASEKASLNFRKNITVQPRMRIAKNSNFCSTSNRRAVSICLMKTKMLDAAGFPVTSKDRPPSCSRIDLIIIFFKLLVPSLSCPLYGMNRCISF